jgi:predicted nucleic acid-binding protein
MVRLINIQRYYTRVKQKIHLLQFIMAQHFTFLMNPSTHAGLRPMKAKKRQKVTKMGYDAAYLELALRRGAPLATLDADLAKAAKKAGVQHYAAKN